MHTAHRITFSNGQKTRPGHCPRQQLIGQRPSMIDQVREVFCQARFPASLIYALIVSPSPALPSTLCRLPLVILQQAAQSFPAPHCSRVPSCLRLRYNWLPLSTASLRRELFRSTRRNLHRFLGTERNTPFRFRDHLVPTYLVSLFNLPLPDWVPFPVGIRIRLSPH
jgi:hypothetical protein